MQLLINVVALSVFQFDARGLLIMLLKEQRIEFDDFIEQRKTELVTFIINAVEGR